MPKFEIKNNEITVEKEITKIDEFVINALGIIEKYSKYAIIGGYVSIFFGRSRATEDIDVFIEDLGLIEFEKLYNEFKQKGCELTIEDAKSLYKDYLKDNLSIRVWEKGFPLLNLKVKIAKSPAQKMAIEERIKVKLRKVILYFGPIEGQIAYKRYILKGQKDLEDARHLEIVFKGLNQKRIEEYRKVFEDEFRR